MTRLLRHYQGRAALQAPPATLELIPRVEYLLILAQVELHKACSPIVRLQQLLDTARRCKMLSLETDLHLALAEVAFVQGDEALLRHHFQEGCEMASLHGLRQALHELKMRRPELAVCIAQAPCPVSANGGPLLSQRELEVLRLIAKGIPISRLQISCLSPYIR